MQHLTTSKCIGKLNHIMLGSLLLVRSAGQARLFEKKRRDYSVVMQIGPVKSVNA